MWSWWRKKWWLFVFVGPVVVVAIVLTLCTLYKGGSGSNDGQADSQKQVADLQAQNADLTKKVDDLTKQATEAKKAPAPAATPAPKPASAPVAPAPEPVSKAMGKADARAEAGGSVATDISIRAGRCADIREAGEAARKLLEQQGRDGYVSIDIGQPKTGPETRKASWPDANATAVNKTELESAKVEETQLEGDIAAAKKELARLGFLRDSYKADYEKHNPDPGQKAYNKKLWEEKEVDIGVEKSKLAKLNESLREVREKISRLTAR